MSDSDETMCDSGDLCEREPMFSDSEDEGESPSILGGIKKATPKRLLETSPAGNPSSPIAPLSPQFPPPSSKIKKLEVTKEQISAIAEMPDSQLTQDEPQTKPQGISEVKKNITDIEEKIKSLSKLQGKEGKRIVDRPEYIQIKSSMTVLRLALVEANSTQQKERQELVQINQDGNLSQETCNKLRVLAEKQKEILELFKVYQTLVIKVKHLKEAQPTALPGLQKCFGIQGKLAMKKASNSRKGEPENNETHSILRVSPVEPANTVAKVTAGATSKQYVIHLPLNVLTTLSKQGHLITTPCHQGHVVTNLASQGQLTTNVAKQHVISQVSLAEHAQPAAVTHSLQNQVNPRNNATGIPSTIAQILRRASIYEKSHSVAAPQGKATAIQIISFPKTTTVVSSSTRKTSYETANPVASVSKTPFSATESKESLISAPDVPGISSATPAKVSPMHSKQTRYNSVDAGIGTISASVAGGTSLATVYSNATTHRGLTSAVSTGQVETRGDTDTRTSQKGPLSRNAKIGTKTTPIVIDQETPGTGRKGPLMNQCGSQPVTGKQSSLTAAQVNIATNVGNATQERQDVRPIALTGSAKRVGAEVLRGCSPKPDVSPLTGTTIATQGVKAATVGNARSFAGVGSGGSCSTPLKVPQGDVKMLLYYHVIQPGDNVLSVQVQERSFETSLRANGQIQSAGGEIFHTPMAWLKAVTGSKTPMKQAQAYNKICYKGKPLSSFSLPAPAQGKKTASAAVKDALFGDNSSRINSTSSKDTRPTSSGNPVDATDRKTAHLIVTLTDLTHLMRKCRVRVIADQECMSSSSCLPTGFWEKDFNNVDMRRILSDEVWF